MCWGGGKKGSAYCSVVWLFLLAQLEQIYFWKKGCYLYFILW